MSNPAAGEPAGSSPCPTGIAVVDGIAVDIGTRAGPVTVVFTGRATAWACPAAGAFTYRGRRYTGSVFVSGPGWRGSAGLGLRLHPAGTTAGRGISDTIAGIIGAAVATHVRVHPHVLDLAAHARAQARQARTVRDLELLAIEITAAEQHLAGLRSRRTQLRALARPGHRARPGGKPAPTNTGGGNADMGKIVRIRWTRHSDWQATFSLDDAQAMFGTASETEIARQLAADPSLAATWEEQGAAGRSSLGISSVTTLSEPEILEQNEGQFYLYDDGDPPGVHMRASNRPRPLGRSPAAAAGSGRVGVPH